MSTEQTIFDYTITVPYSTNLFVIAGGKHSYSSFSGNSPWQLRIYFDGNQVNYAGGAGAVTDSPSVFASITQVSTGNHDVKLTWYGASGMSLSGVNLLVLSAAK